MESAWFRLEEEAEQLEAASFTRLRRSSRLSTEVRHRLEESFFSSSILGGGGGGGSASSAFMQGAGLTSRRFEMQARVNKRDLSSAAASSFGSAANFAKFAASPPPPRPPFASTFPSAPAAKRDEDATASTPNIATRRTAELARRFGMFTRENTKEPSAMSPRDELDEVRRDLRHVKEENLKLQAVITDVTEVNKRWQKYNNDRQMYVERLLSTIQDQQEQMNKNIENRLHKTKESEDGSDVTRQVHAENAKLRDEIGQLKRRMECMEREHKEHVEVLEIQVKANKDDWEAEKREKELARQENERLLAKIQDLQEQLNLYKLQLTEEKSSTDHISSSQRKHCCCGDNGREGHCSSHITICRKNSFPTFRTSVHMPGHLIPRGSTIYLGDDLVIDGDSSGSKPALATDSGIQESPSSCSEDNSSLASPQEVPMNIPVEGATESSGTKDKVESRDMSSLDIPASLGVMPSTSTSTVSSASSMSMANIAVSKVDHAIPYSKEVTAITRNLVSSSLKSLSASHHPLPSSFSDTAVPDRVHRASKDARWNLKTLPSPLRIGTNVEVVAEERDGKLKSHDLLVPNLTAVDGLEEFPDGVPTQTREDVICPGCGRVFHPEIHLQFLQHFGECQSRNKANKAGTFKTRN